MLRSFRARGNLFPLLLVGVLLLSQTAAFAVETPPAADQETAVISQAVLSFLQAAQDDYRAALQKYANEGTQKKYEELDAALWPVTDPVKGWSFFFSTCVISFGTKLPTGQVPVAFYNPWSDVFLLTVWRADNAGRGTMMTGSDVVMGDFVRQQGKPPFQTSRIWMRDDMYRPVAVGIATAGTVLAFEKIFRSGATVKESWRELIPNLKDPKILEANYYGAGAMLAENLKELVAATVAVPADDASKAYRERFPRVLRQMNDGKMAELLTEASGTSPEMQAVLLKMPAQEWKNFRITSFLPGKTKCLVMLSKGNDPDVYLGLLLTLSGKEAKLERMDLFSFQSFYEEFAKNPGGAV